LSTPKSSWTSGPLTSLLRSSGPSSGRHRRLATGVSWRRRQQPKQAHEGDRGSREDDPRCCRAADQGGTDHHHQHARKKESGPPASPQDPRHTRRPAARALACRGGGQAERPYRRGHLPVIIFPPWPHGHSPRRLMPMMHRACSGDRGWHRPPQGDWTRADPERSFTQWRRVTHKNTSGCKESICRRAAEPVEIV